MSSQLEWRIVCSNGCRDHEWRKPNAESAAAAAVKMNEQYERLKGLRARQGCAPWTVHVREIGDWRTHES